MTRHVKTNEEAIELAGEAIERLGWTLPATDRQIALHRAMIDSSKMSVNTKNFYEDKIVRFETSKPLILADIAVMEEARNKLANPYAAWADQDETKIDKLAMEQRRIIARMVDKSYSSIYTRGFLSLGLDLGF